MKVSVNEVKYLKYYIGLVNFGVEYFKGKVSHSKVPAENYAVKEKTHTLDNNVHYNKHCAAGNQNVHHKIACELLRLQFSTHCAIQHSTLEIISITFSEMEIALLFHHWMCTNFRTKNDGNEL